MVKTREHYPRDDSMTDSFLYYNEQCAQCGTPADLHHERGHKFVRFDPPKAAYSTEWWEGGEKKRIHDEQHRRAAKEVMELSEHYSRMGLW